jgi:hypothetical protein
MRPEERAVRRLGRAAAALGVVCVVLHLATATAGGHGGAVRTAVLLGMAALCLPCVRSLWRRPHERAWRVTALMYGGMLFVHLLLLTAAGAASGHGVSGHGVAGHGASGQPGWAELGMWAGLVLAAVEVGLAGAVLAGSRARARPLVTA